LHRRELDAHGSLYSRDGGVNARELLGGVFDEGPEGVEGFLLVVEEAVLVGLPSLRREDLVDRPGLRREISP
jgi:hypothetical protein